jgi:hypothetical protein
MSTPIYVRLYLLSKEQKDEVCPDPDIHRGRRNEVHSRNGADNKNALIIKRINQLQNDCRILVSLQGTRVFNYTSSERSFQMQGCPPPVFLTLFFRK